MNKSFMDDEEEIYEDEEDMDDDLEDNMDLDVFDEEDEDLDQISSYWRSDSSSEFGRKRKTSKYSRDLDF